MLKKSELRAMLLAEKRRMDDAAKAMAGADDPFVKAFAKYAERDRDHIDHMLANIDTAPVEDDENG